MGRERSELLLAKSYRPNLRVFDLAVAYATASAPISAPVAARSALSARRARGVFILATNASNSGRRAAIGSQLDPSLDFSRRGFEFFDLLDTARAYAADA